jgi:hypothetical protein
MFHHLCVKVSSKLKVIDEHVKNEHNIPLSRYLCLRAHSNLNHPILIKWTLNIEIDSLSSSQVIKFSR